MNDIGIRFIAKVHTDFKEKFGIPRQSNLIKNTEGRIIFEPEFRNKDYIKGLENFSHIWVIWCFSKNIDKKYSATVRPPRLGGNVRVGVFASRSPFRPNPIGMSCVKIKNIEIDNNLGPVINILGADILDGTPVLDIKPYVGYSDCIPEAKEGYAEANQKKDFKVIYLNNTENIIPYLMKEIIEGIIKQDPRPAYQDDPSREYGMKYSNYNIKFSIDNDIIYITNIVTE